MLKKVLIILSLFTIANTQASHKQLLPTPIKSDFYRKCMDNDILAKFLRTTKMSPDKLQEKLESFGVNTTSLKIKLNHDAQAFLRKASSGKKS